MKTHLLRIMFVAIVFFGATIDAEAGLFGRRCCRPRTCTSSGGGTMPRSSSELQAQIIQLQNIIQAQQGTINNHEARVRELEARP